MPPIGRRVRPAVVVDDDHEVAGVVVGDVVERLPRHAAGERAVADDGDDVAVALRRSSRTPSRCRRPTRASSTRASTRRRRARLGALRVAGEAAGLAQRRESWRAGQELVHVRLVAGVEDDRVARRVEHPVDGDRQLDHAEVRAEVTAGLRDVLDEDFADLARELPSCSCSAHRGRAVRDRLEQRSSVPPGCGGATPASERVYAGHAGSPRRAIGAAGRSPTAPRDRVAQTSERSTYCRMPPLR